MNQRIPVITQKQVTGFLPKRPRDSHKGQFGTVVVIGGTSGMIGAPLLAGRAALKLGAGCVHVGLLAENAPGIDLLQPELMLHSATEGLRHLPLPQAGEAEREGRSRTNVRSMFNSAVLAIGCGMGKSGLAYKLLYESLHLRSPLVLDADALNLLAGHADLQDDLRSRKAPSIITPHPGEAARLLACKSGEVQADRVAAVQQLAQNFNCSVVLKGADSLCATRGGKLFMNKTGNPGMSSAGMGDVLTGMIAAFIAQGLTADNAMLLAVHLHGAAGDALVQQGVSIGMTASEVTEWARWLLSQWLSN